MTGLHRTRSVALAVAWRGLHNAFTRPTVLLPTVVTPLVFFIAFAGGLSSLRHTPHFSFRSGYTSFEFVFVCFQASAFGGVSTGLSIAADFESGFARRLLLAAPHHGAIIIGYVVSTIVRTMFVLCVLLCAGLLGGMHIDGRVEDVLMMLLLALVMSAVSTLWVAGIALRLRTLRGGPLMQLPVFSLVFLAPVYVPLASLDGWIHDVAGVNPVSALVEAGRGLISGQPTRMAPAVACLVGLFVLTAIWARGGLRSAERAG